MEIQEVAAKATSAIQAQLSMRVIQGTLEHGQQSQQAQQPDKGQRLDIKV
ncbi:hypothetical protein [Desulfohalovibrio reitneri]|nr:hypothetical protein [Desulfohalovibrio reitneri]